MNTNQVNEHLLNFLTECMRISQMRDPDVAISQLDTAIDNVLREMLDCQSPSSDERGIDYEESL